MNAAALLLAALASTPPGSLRTAPSYSDYPSREACEAGIAARLAVDRARAPEPGTRFELEGPARDGDGHLAYRLVRIVTVEAPGVVTRTAYIDEHVCEGARYRFVADGWVRTEMAPPPPPPDGR